MTDRESEREPGSWIGQHPDQTTEEIRKGLDEGAKRVSVTDNESDDAVKEGGSPQGHREEA